MAAFRDGRDQTGRAIEPSPQWWVSCRVEGLGHWPGRRGDVERGAERSRVDLRVRGEPVGPPGGEGEGHDDVVVDARQSDGLWKMDYVMTIS